MTRNDIRHANLLALVEEFGTIAAVASAANTSEKYLWQIIHKEPLPSGKIRGIGNDVAEKLELGCGKFSGWLDQIPGGRTLHERTITPGESELVKLYRAASPEKRKALLAVARLAEP